MEQEVLSRIAELIEGGDRLASQRHHGRGEYSGPDYWVQADLLTNVQAWINSVANLVHVVTPVHSFYRGELARLTAAEEKPAGITWGLVLKVEGC